MKKNIIILFCVLSIITSAQVSITATSTITCVWVNGKAFFNSSGIGIAPYTFMVLTPSCTSNFTSTASSGSAIFNLPCVGTYTFIIADSTNTPLGSYLHTVSSNTYMPYYMISPVSYSNPYITCTNSLVAFHAINTASPVSYSVAWSAGGIGNSFTPSYSVVNQVITATITVLSNGCTQTATNIVQSNYNLPTFTIVPSITSCSTCCNGQINIISNSPGDTYTLNGVSQGSLTTFTNICNTKQVVCVSDVTSGCIKCDSILSLVSTGIKINNYDNDKLNIYPNPANEVINVEFLAFNNEAYKIEIINTLGQVVLNQIATTNKVALNINSFNSGVYFVNVYSAKGIVNSQKLIVIK